MYTKQNLITDIENFQTTDTIESAHKAAILDLLHSTDGCFERHNFPGHVTGSALLVSPDGQQALLTHHRILNRWFQFGGHADGQVDIREVALREAQEESGITEIEFIVPDILDIDVHEIPANPKKNEPAHLHYDIRYLLRARRMDFAVTTESHSLRWFRRDELGELDLDASVWRIIDKWAAILPG